MIDEVSNTQTHERVETQSERLEEVSKFLSAFYPSPYDEIRIRAFPAKGDEGFARKKVVTRKQLETDADLQQELHELNRTKGLYFVVNGGGDIDRDIIFYNAFFAEIDDVPINEQHTLLDSAPLQPSIRVETKKSVHAYWLRQEIGNQTVTTVEREWRDIQARLIAYFKGDPKIKNPSRLMRLPYFDHVSIDGEQGGYSHKSVEVVRFDANLRYTTAEMQDAFPEVWNSADGTDIPANSDEAEFDHSITQETEVRTDLSTWDGLNAEACRRIRGTRWAKISADGLWLHTKGICHNGKGDSGLFLNFDSGAYGCMKEPAACDTATILRALGLPERPESIDGEPITPLAVRWSEFAQEDICESEKVLFELEHGEVGLLLASTNVGKTTLAMNLSLMLAAGQDFQPICNAKEGGRRVLYIDGESRRARFQWNVDKMISDWGEDDQKLVGQNLHIVCDSVTRAEPLNLSSEAHLKELSATATNIKPDLIIIDTMSALFTLQSESDNAEVSKRVMRPLAKLACDSGAAVLLIHHIGKQSEDAHAGSKAYRGRGASAIGAFARLVLLLKPDSNDEQRVSLICAKCKGSRFDDVVLKLDPDTRWFTNTGEAVVKRRSNYQLIVEFVREAKHEVKRDEIARHMASLSKAQLTKLLKSAVVNGDLQSPKHGWYVMLQNAHLLNAVDSKHSDMKVLPNTHVPEVITTGEIGMAHLL